MCVEVYTYRRNTCCVHTIYECEQTDSRLVSVSARVLTSFSLFSRLVRERARCRRCCALVRQHLNSIQPRAGNYVPRIFVPLCMYVCTCVCMRCAFITTKRGKILCALALLREPDLGVFSRTLGRCYISVHAGKSGRVNWMPRG